MTTLFDIVMRNLQVPLGQVVLVEILVLMVELVYLDLLQLIVTP